MRIILLIYLVTISSSLYSQFIESKSGRLWQVHLYQGSTNSSSSVTFSYATNPYKSITYPTLTSYSLGISCRSPLKKWIDIEYSLAWHRFQFKIIYDPVDSLSWYGDILTDQRRFDFLQLGSALRKDIKINEIVFFSLGAGLNADYALSVIQTTLERVPLLNVLQTRSRSIEDKEPSFNVGYQIYCGIGWKLRRTKEISIRASRQNLFYNTYSPYERKLSSWGYSIVYQF